MRASRVAAIALGLGALLVVLWPSLARAHGLEPAMLGLRERAPGQYEGVWRVPQSFDPAALSPVFPEGSERTVRGGLVRDGGAWVTRFALHVPGGLGGRTIALSGPLAASEEALVRIESDAGILTGRVPAGGSFAVPLDPSAFDVARTYAWLGVEHILGGFDHLLFVLALLLLAPSLRALIATVTGFTLAHSLTLGLAAVGIVDVPGPPVEATIALSIVFVARELWQRERGAALPSPVRLWWVAFGFGLLHGLGFAGALSEVGLPAGEVPLALLCFNVGVELGQLVFVALVRLAIAWLPQALRARVRATQFGSYAIGTIASFFLCERVVALLS